jgi:predicted nuclease of predicted toxin-antitoxin system
VLRFLIDECCTPEIVAVALERGYHAVHVSHMGLGGTADHRLIPIITENDYSFITNNRADFLRLYRNLSLHPGLLIIVPSLPVDAQRHLMAAMLDAIAERADDIVNCLVEVHADGNVTIGDWPHMEESNR